jgi:hypothetical protein
VRDIEEPKEDYLFDTSAEVRSMILKGNPRWRELVPEIVLKTGPWAEGKMTC